MSPRVIRVLPQQNYILLVTFDNGEEGLLDMSEYLDLGVFTKLREPSEFAKVNVAFKTIEWACGADLDPEFVYSKTIKLQPVRQA